MREYIIIGCIGFAACAGGAGKQNKTAHDTAAPLQTVGPSTDTVRGIVSAVGTDRAGTLMGTTLEATRFIVRTVDGASATDGTLKTEGSRLYIVTADGSRTRIAAPRPPVVGRDGARVWITGDPSRGVEAFGFIDPPR